MVGFKAFLGPGSSHMIPISPQCVFKAIKGILRADSPARLLSTFEIFYQYTWVWSYYTIFDPRNPMTWVLKSYDLYLKTLIWPLFGTITVGVLRMMVPRQFFVYSLFDPKE